jgi:hypothetical protein
MGLVTACERTMAILRETKAFRGKRSRCFRRSLNEMRVQRRKDGERKKWENGPRFALSSLGFKPGGRNPGCRKEFGSLNLEALVLL